VRSPRHVGRVVDPLVRDDGVDEPEIDVDPALANDDEVGGFPVPRRVNSPAEPEPEPETKAPLRIEGAKDTAHHPVRERLLAKAAEAAARRAEEKAGEPPAEHTNSTEDLLGAFTDELDRVAGRDRARLSSSSILVGRRELPPNVIALFATLLGLAVVAALFAVLIHLDPRDGTPLPAASRPVAEPVAPVASAAPNAPAMPVAKKPERKHVQGPWRIADSTDAKLKKIEGSIGHESFLKALEQAGVAVPQTFRVLKVMKELRDLDHCNPRDQFAALVDRASNKVVAFEYIAGKEEVYQAREGADGFLKSSKLDLMVERTRVQGAIRFDRDTFTASVEAAGFEPSLSNVIDEALAGHATVADFRRGDRLRVVAQEVTVLGDFSRYAGIEALEVLSAKDEKPLRVYYFRGTKSHGYYDAEGRAVHEGSWRKPIKGAPITSHFNPKRMHPILHKIMPHEGTDFGAAMGTPVGAAGPGIVHFLGNGGPSGNLVVIQHAGGIETGYAHLSRFESGLKLGDHVVALQIVGYVGSTGRSTGPHLHFSVKRNGAFVDSETLKLDALQILPLDERMEFVGARSKLDSLLDAIPLPPPLNERAPEPAPPESAEAPGDDLGAPESVPTAMPMEQPGAPQPPAAPQAPGAPQVPAAPSPVAPGRAPSIYLSDQELLKAQPRTDDGEVER
jgi:murein DD-endopeptidase MepM/ murein hydrolase activator NlpD